MHKDITVVICTSPIRSHPDTTIIDETIASIRHHLPDSEIIIQFDGVRAEQEYLRDQYNEFKTRMLFKCLHEYDNVLPLIFEEHQHQSGMMRNTMQDIKTDLILYVEADTPLVTDRSIEWIRIIDFIQDGQANTVRFHFEDQIPSVHDYLMIGIKHPFTKTIQWSQRPHLSTKAYYQQILDSFEANAKHFIEDIHHGTIINDYHDLGNHGWYKHRLWIYTPKGGIRRSTNLDGRKDEEKYKQSFEQ